MLLIVSGCTYEIRKQIAMKCGKIFEELFIVEGKATPQKFTQLIFFHRKIFKNSLIFEFTQHPTLGGRGRGIKVPNGESYFLLQVRVLLKKR